MNPPAHSLPHKPATYRRSTTILLPTPGRRPFTAVQSAASIRTSYTSRRTLKKMPKCLALIRRAQPTHHSRVGSAQPTHLINQRSPPDSTQIEPTTHDPKANASITDPEPPRCKVNVPPPSPASSVLSYLQRSLLSFRASSPRRPPLHTIASTRSTTTRTHHRHPD